MKVTWLHFTDLVCTLFSIFVMYVLSGTVWQIFKNIMRTPELWRKLLRTTEEEEKLVGRLQPYRFISKLQFLFFVCVLFFFQFTFYLLLICFSDWFLFFKTFVVFFTTGKSKDCSATDFLFFCRTYLDSIIRNCQKNMCISIQLSNLVYLHLPSILFPIFIYRAINLITTS